MSDLRSKVVAHLEMQAIVTGENLTEEEQIQIRIEQRD